MKPMDILELVVLFAVTTLALMWIVQRQTHDGVTLLAIAFFYTSLRLRVETGANGRRWWI